MNFIYSVAILSGTIIGAGIFALPYLAKEVGFLNMLLYLFVIGGVSVLVHLFFGNLSRRTPDFLRLPGFAEIHLGSWAKKISMITGICGLMGATLAYIILGGSFLNSLLPEVSLSFMESETFYSLVYFFLGATFIYFGVKAVGKISFYGVISFIVVLFFIFIRGWSSIEIGNITNFMTFKGSFSDFFLPYGVILFSFQGAALIPEIEELLKGQKENLNKAIILGVTIPLFLYIFFIIIVLGITGGSTTSESIIGLQENLTNGVISAALIFGILVTFTSFVAVGLTLKKIIWYDLKIPENMSFLITMFVPLFLFGIGIRSYIDVIGVIGAIFLAIDAIFITVMYQKYKTARYCFITCPLIVVFVLGIIYQICYYF
ncbi:MAG: aromatic amino acid transport family protein [Patescibacteria group bacterium]|nr:aromatic amino acid transport family protein [Patescibacteria group bacterium]